MGYNTAQCIRCGNTIQMLDDIDSFPAFPCRAEMSQAFKNNDVDPLIIKKYTSNAPIEAHNGHSKECTKQEIQNRYDICMSCENFDNNTCTKCGCILSRDKIFFNKLLWKNESCPEKKW